MITELLMSVFDVIILQSYLGLNMSVLQRLTSLGNVKLFIVSQNTRLDCTLQVSACGKKDTDPALSQYHPLSVLVKQIFDPSLMLVVQRGDVCNFQQGVSITP